VVCSGRAGRGHPASNHPKAFPVDIHDITTVKLPTTAQLGLAVDFNLASGDGGLGLTTRFDDAGQLEELPKANHVVADRNISHHRIIEPARRPAGATRGMNLDPILARVRRQLFCHDDDVVVISSAQRTDEIDVIDVDLDGHPDWSAWIGVPGKVIGVLDGELVSALLNLVVALPESVGTRCFLPRYAIRLRSGRPGQQATLPATAATGRPVRATP